MSTEPDLLILGAGPAGVGAALAASGCGLRTLVVDAAADSGGQVYRALPASFTPLPAAARSADPDRRRGTDQRQALQQSSARTAFGRQVWSVGEDFRVDALGPGGAQHWRPKALLAATGAHERVTPFPGWTLPGVIGLAAATVLLKSQLMLPGRRTVVAGCGPLLALVAYTVVRHGGDVVAVLDLARRRDWLQTAPALLTRPAELGRGLDWRRRLLAAKVPWLSRRGIVSVRPSGEGLTISAGPVLADGALRGAVTEEFDADCVAVGHGLTPSTDVTRLLRAEHAFRRELGGWVPVLDADQRTSRAGLYAAGDGCGIRGAAVAYEAGAIAGYTAALDLGAIEQLEYRRRSAPHRKRRQRLERFSRAMAAMMAQRSGQVQAIDADTVVCRCEEVSRGDIDQALARGAQDLHQLKSWTRCGMGPCQGRVCGDTAAELMSSGAGRARVGLWTPRVPLRPLDMAAFTGTFQYADIPIPRAAPL